MPKGLPRWVMVAGQSGGKSSLLGEVWYAEAAHPTGPFATAVKVVTHDRQSFFNVCHHPFLDRDGGRFIHFEGTYTSEFSGNPDKTPRYEYNQVLYRLDLDCAALQPARVKSAICRTVDGGRPSPTRDVAAPRVTAACLLVDNELAHAFRTEAVAPRCHCWGVSYGVIRGWRRALGVNFANKSSTYRLMEESARIGAHTQQERE